MNKMVMLFQKKQKEEEKFMCLKKFDYELYGGVCPKCGNYMRMTEMETSENENCEIESSHVHVDRKYAPDDAQKVTPSVIVITILVILILLAGITCMIFVIAAQKRGYEAVTIKEDISIKVQQTDRMQLHEHGKEKEYIEIALPKE